MSSSRFTGAATTARMAKRKKNMAKRRRFIMRVYTTFVTSSVRLGLSKFVTSNKFSKFGDCSSLGIPSFECSSVQ
jgi:hypothetical protein